MNIYFWGYVKAVNDNSCYVATWKMFDGEKSRKHYMTMTKNMHKGEER